MNGKRTHGKKKSPQKADLPETVLGDEEHLSVSQEDGETEVDQGSMHWSDDHWSRLGDYPGTLDTR